MSDSRKGTQKRGVKLPPLPRQYTSKEVRSDGSITRKYTDGLRTRIEAEDVGRPRHVHITRPDIGVWWTIYPDAGQYSEKKYDTLQIRQVADPNQGMIWEDAGSDIIDGRKYARYRGVLRNAPNQEKAHYIQFLDPKTGERRRYTTFDKKGNRRLTVDMYMELGPPADASLFELPAGLERIEVSL